MPGLFLHVGATAMCPHGGQATPSAPNPRVLVSGSRRDLASAVLVAGCAFSPPAGNGPCVTAQWLVGRLRVLRSVGSRCCFRQPGDLRADRHAAHADR